MRVLVLSRNAWDDTNSIGNTLSNLLGELPDAEFANIYFRASKPNNRVCTRYYHVTEKDILRNWFSPSHAGRAFSWNPEQREETKGSNEAKLISFIHRFHLGIAYRISDALWDSRKWINDGFRAFIRDFRPDYVFSFVKADPQYYWTIRYLRECGKVKSVFWIADDEYTLLSESLASRSRIRIERLKYLLSGADKVYGCSEEICTYYGSIFGCEVSPLYKRCSLSYPVRDAVSTPLRMVYAGNLLFGRLEIIKKIVAVLSEVNNPLPELRLDIFSGTPVSEKDLRALNVKDVSAFHGVRTYSEIQEIMAQSDIVLLIESFEKEQIVKTRYSFSTKIIDCLQSGSVLLAIGPGEISSILYSDRIPGAVTIKDPGQIAPVIRTMIANKHLLPEYARMIRSYAEEYHAEGRDWLNFDSACDG